MTMNIDWNSCASDLLLNPSYPVSEQKRFLKILEWASAFKGHLWLSTSGSTVLKWVGLSKQAILASADAVNQHLQSTYTDRWILTLPHFHVGGLGILARSYLSGALVFDYRQSFDKWHAELFCQYAAEKKGTLTSLVPTQVFDLVKKQLQAPQSLRAVVIGGGALSPELYQQAICLGWPLLPSYGLTECSSQVATAALDSWQKGEYPSFHLLSHVESKVMQQRLCFKGKSLLSAYAVLSGEMVEFIDPKQEGWFMSEDRGFIEGQTLIPNGRQDQMIKIGGESVDLAKLERTFQNLRLELNLELNNEYDLTLIAYPDERLGTVIHLVAVNLTEELLKPFIDSFNHHVLPFERIRKIHVLPFIPKSSLGKVRKHELIQLIQSVSK